MKKIFLILCFLFIYNNTYSRWYWDHNIWHWKSWIKECNDDRDTRWWVWDTRYNKDHRVINRDWWASWNMVCQYWDWANPNNPTSLTLSNVKNSDNVNCNYIWWQYFCRTLNISLTYNWSWQSDTGWSWLRDYQLVFQRASDWAWIYHSWWITWNSKAINLSSLRDWLYYTWVRGRDNALNINRSFFRWTDVIIDKTPPTVSDITNSNNSNLLANNNYNYSISVWVNWWSPINRIRWVRERDENGNIDETFSCVSSPCNVAWNIQNVDFTRLTNWAREYTFRITKMCDQAWNCWNGAKDYNHNVYANTNNITKTYTEQLSNSFNIADWTAKNMNITLRDNYWNAIVPASWINRTIDFNFSANNSLYLNQYLKTWNSSVYLNWSIYPIWNPSNKSFDNQLSTNWIYPFIFKVYTTTLSAYTKAYWDFKNISVNYDINQTSFWNISWVNVLSNLESKFKPLYTTTFSWDIKTYWFIEWVVQDSNINISKNWSTATSWNKLYVEFGSWAQASSPSFDMKVWSINVWEWNTHYSLLQNSLNSIANLNTLLTQVWSISSLNNQYFSTHISYSLDWHDIVYNSDIIWKANYWWTSAWNNTTQVWLKVIWKTHDSDINYIINWQQADISVLWNLTKSSLKRDIRSNVFSIIKSIKYDINIYWNDLNISSWDWWFKLNDNIRYFDLRNKTDKNVVINWWSISWNKTVVVLGWNIYITWNISYPSSNSTLWIIVLKDDDWKWWNVYIKPSVTNIVWSIYADKSILSYDTTYCASWELTTSCGWTQAVLANQLYIYGQVFAENTIGW